MNFIRRKRKIGGAAIRENLVVRHEPLTQQFPAGVEDYSERKLMANAQAAGRSSDAEPKACRFEDDNGSTAEINKDGASPTPDCRSVPSPPNEIVERLEPEELDEVNRRSDPNNEYSEPNEASSSDQLADKAQKAGTSEAFREAGRASTWEQ